MSVKVDFSPTDINKVADHLDGVNWTSESNFTALCPAHDDRNPSLSVSIGDNNKLLMYCHAGCEFAEINAALKERKAYTGQRPEKPRPSKDEESEGYQRITSVRHKSPEPDFGKLLGRQPSAIYRYADVQDQTVGYVTRIDKNQGKRIIPVTPWFDENGELIWRCKGFENPRPLYGLDDLAHAEDDKPVLIVEGEKTADAALEIFGSHTVLTWHGGANAVGQTDFQPLMGRDVTIWPDADESGKSAAREIARSLRNVSAASVKIVNLPDALPASWDLADEVPDGVDINALLNDARPFKNNLIEYLMSAKELAGMKIQPRK